MSSGNNNLSPAGISYDAKKNNSDMHVLFSSGLPYSAMDHTVIAFVVCVLFGIQGKFI